MPRHSQSRNVAYGRSGNSGDRVPETVTVSSENKCSKCTCETDLPAALPDCGKEKKGIIDKITEAVSPFFRKLFGRDAQLEDIIVAGLIILLLYEKFKSRGEKEEKNESFSLKNLSDNDILLVALFYIFL